MENPIVVILLTALLSSLLTLALALLIFHRYLRRRLQTAMDLVRSGLDTLIGRSDRSES